MNQNKEKITDYICRALKIKDSNRLFFDVQEVDFTNQKEVRTFTTTLKVAYKVQETHTYIQKVIANALGFKNYQALSALFKKNKQYKIDYLQEVDKVLKKRGFSGLLPHNLPNHILDECSRELDTIHSEEYGKPEIKLCATIVNLLNKNVDVNIFEFYPSKELLIKHLDIFSVMVGFESLKRAGILKIEESDLPKVENFFELEGRVKIKILDRHHMAEKVYQKLYASSNSEH